MPHISRFLHRTSITVLFAATGFQLLACNPMALSQQLTILGYHLQASSRTSVYQYDYTYTADLTNSGTAVQDVVGTVTSNSANTIVLKGSVNFGSVPAQSTIASTDTFTIRQDRRYPFDLSSLNWSLAPVTGLITLSQTSFDFGPDLVGTSVLKNVATVTNTGSISMTLQPTITGDGAFTLDLGSCSGRLAPGSACSIFVNYLPSAAAPQGQAATVQLNASSLSPGSAQTIAVKGESATLDPGTVSVTNNPQVALYSINLPFPGSVTIRFGTDVSYGRSTWTQTSATAGPVSIFVAGMFVNSTYHMQANVQFTGGVTAADRDHIFTTQAPPNIPNLTVAATSGLTPQAGIEQLSLVTGAALGLSVTDLQGRLLWQYNLPNNASNQFRIEGAKLLPNGHYLLSIGQGSSEPLIEPYNPTGSVIAIREIDLAGNIIHDLTAADLTSKLQSAGYNIQLLEFHHDVTPLPNGHTLVLASVVKTFTDLPGRPGLTNVLGDVVVDVDTNYQPVWVWNEFDHLDVNRQPMGFPDWTHTNAVIYSPTDGNIIVSIRHQNWVVKVDYRDGTGSGNILWRLGYQGDFALGNGIEPTDWQYAQHFPSLFSRNSAGVFSLGVMDNGDDRVFPTGTVCDANGAPPCLYTTIPVFQIDENARTATLVFHQILPTSLYSFYGGNTELLANGDIEYALSGTSQTDSDLFEVTPSSTPLTVWHMHAAGNQTYRGYRIPSLYPGVQW